MTGLGGGLWGVLFPDGDDGDGDGDDGDDGDGDGDGDGGLRNRLARNELGPEPGGPLFLKSAVSGVL